MDTTVLQQKLAEQRHLLPSQQELLNRLLFQLAFNDFQNIGLVGAEGSGKSTLALALAELFSEQANIAMLTGPVTEQELESQLLQQWFGQRQAEPALAELLAEPVTGAQPLLLIVDNCSLLSNSVRQKLLQLDCLGFFMLSQPSADMALNLSINMPTLQDAGQVLQDKSLDALAVAERFAASAGNMHLLHSAVAKADERKSHSAAFWLLPTAIVLLLVAALISWYLPVSKDPAQQTAVTASKEPDTDISQPIVPPETPVNSDSGDISKWVDATDLATMSEPAEAAELNDTSEPADTSEFGDNHELVDTSTLTETAQPVETAELTAQTEGEVDTETVVADEPIEIATDSLGETTPTNVMAPAAQEQQYQEQQLLALPAEFRVLQLAVLSSEAALARFEQAYPDTPIAIYQRSWQGQLQWVVLVQEFYSDVSSARLARASLAEPLRSAGPFIKPVAQVQQEIKALARLRAEPVLQE